MAHNKTEHHTEPLDPTVALARDLVRLESVTPEDGGCQPLIARRLAAAGFDCEQLDFEDVRNLWATRGSGAPLFVFAGHTDVVPTGPLDRWTHPPFDGVIDGGMLHGRGAADMKSSIAAFVVACERFVARHGAHAGTIGLLITSDEEGTARFGTRAAIEALSDRGVQIDCCLVGEPTSVERLGDMAKIGRRGSLGGRLRIHGRQGHVAYPHLAANPIHEALPALTELVSTAWDAGNDLFPPTGFQCSNIHAGTGAANVIPGVLEVDFNFRYSPASTRDTLVARTEEILGRHGLSFEVDWGEPGLPYETAPGALVDAVAGAVRETTGQTPELSATGGTSDGRFIAPTGAQVVEFGPINATIHQVDECVAVDDVAQLARCYERVLEKLLAG